MGGRPAFGAVTPRRGRVLERVLKGGKQVLNKLQEMRACDQRNPRLRRGSLQARSNCVSGWRSMYAAT